MCQLVENIVDPLKWWVNNKLLYPNLHHMALNYLSVPHKWSSCPHCHCDSWHPNHIWHIYGLLSNFDGCGTCILPRSTTISLYSELPITFINPCSALPWLVVEMWFGVTWWLGWDHEGTQEEEGQGGGPSRLVGSPIVVLDFTCL